MGPMFDMLLQLPLFQGLAQEDFTAILEKVKLHFTKHKGGETIVQAGTPCRQLTFILKGEVVMHTEAAQGAYAFSEELQAPLLIEPYSLFGMTTDYASTYTAIGEVHSVNIGKPFILDELSRYEIFRLNYLNILSNRAQTLAGRLWTPEAGETEERIRQFIRTHIERPNGRKRLHIKMEELARIANTSRACISKTLNSMQEKGVVELHRGEIVIPQAERLLLP